MLIEFVIIWVPVLLLINAVVEWTGDYLVLAFFLATAFVKLIICYLYPLLIQPLVSSTEELPAYANDLRPFINKEAESASFNSKVILLERSV